jgi:hypothetical protein
MRNGEPRPPCDTFALGWPFNQFVFRGDVKRFYASIDHAVLLALVRERSAIRECSIWWGSIFTERRVVRDDEHLRICWPITAGTVLHPVRKCLSRITRLVNGGFGGSWARPKTLDCIVRGRAKGPSAWAESYFLH